MKSDSGGKPATAMKNVPVTGNDPRPDVNSKEYWDDRFARDWYSCGGRQQTAFFAHVALSISPAWLLDEIRTRKLSVCDWGCAIGDAARDFAHAFPKSQVTGYDISDVAIAEGRRLFPGLELFAGDLLSEERQFDVIFSSNTLEHFHQPYELLARLGKRARDFLWLLVPFQDAGGIDEHFSRFDYSSIRPRLSEHFVLAFFNNIDVSEWRGSQWHGRQALLIYARPNSLTRIAARGCEVSAPAYREAFVSPNADVATARLADCALRLESLLEQQCELKAALDSSEVERKAAQAETTAALATAETAEKSKAHAEAATAAAQAKLAAAEAARAEAEAKAERSAYEKDLAEAVTAAARAELVAAESARAEAEAKAERSANEKDRAVADRQAVTASLMTAETERLNLLQTATRERTRREKLAEVWSALQRAEIQIVADRNLRGTALAELTELRRSRIWRLARLVRYARTQLLAGSLASRLRGGQRLLRRLVRPGAALPAHDPVFDVMRLLEHHADAVPPTPRPEITPIGREAAVECSTHELVSIVLPVYNHADFLPEAITGILQQTYQNWELIVVDDGSNDDFDAAIAGFDKDPRICVFKQENQRLPATLNNGFRYAHGDYWMWTSADNVMLPQQLETLVASLRADPGAGLVYSDYEAIDDSGLPLQDLHWRAHNRADGGSLIRLPRETTIENFHNSGDNFLGGSFLYRAEIAAVVGAYEPDAFGGEDYDFWLRMHLVTRFRHVEDVLYRYRVHDNTLTARVKELDLESNIHRLRSADHDRRTALLVDGTLAPTGNRPWRDPAQYVTDAGRIEQWLYSARTPTRAATDAGASRVCVIDVPLRKVDLDRLREFDIVVVPDKATWCWLRDQALHPRVRLLHGEPSAFGPALAHAAALRSFERRRASDADGLASARKPVRREGYLPKHVLLLLDSWRGGGLERIAAMLARDLSRLGVKTTLGLAADAKAPPALIDELRAPSGVQVQAFASDTAKLSHFLHTGRVTHASLHHTLFGLDLLRLAGVASVYTFHNSYVWFEPAKRLQWCQALRAADFFIAVSRQVASFAIEAVAVPAETIRIVPNGVEIDSALSVAAPAERTPGTPFHFINVASFNRIKQQNVLLDAFAALVRERPQVRLSLVGPPYDVEFYQQILATRERLGLTGKVEVTPGEGHASTLRQVAGADCFVLPSAIEGWSLALTEAAVLGVPCVATDVGGAEDLRQLGAAIRLVPAMISEPGYLTSTALGPLLANPPRRVISGLTEGMASVIADATALRAKAQSAAKELRAILSVTQMTEGYLDAFARARFQAAQSRRLDAIL